MKFDVVNKVVVVTGASSGIGAATAILLNKEGAKVVLAARSETALAETVKACSHPENTLVVTTDVSKESDCKRLIEETVKTYGKIDLLLYNAGLSMRGLIDQVDPIVFERLMGVNFWGAFHCIRFALPHLLKTKGMVVGVSSVSGFKALPGRSAYTASKHAFNGLLESVKIENLKSGVHVLTVCPGFTATNIRINALNEKGMAQGESPRDETGMMTSEQVSKHIVKAIQKKKDFIVLTKQAKFLYWLNKFAPNFISKKVFESFEKEPNSPLRTDIVHEQ